MGAVRLTEPGGVAFKVVRPHDGAQHRASISHQVCRAVRQLSDRHGVEAERVVDDDTQDATAQPRQAQPQNQACSGAT